MAFICIFLQSSEVFPGGSDSKESANNVGDPDSIPGSGRSLGQEDPVEKGMAMHSSILAWRISWTEEPGGLQSMGLQKSFSIHACYLSSKAAICKRFSVPEERVEPMGASPLLMGSQGWGQGSSENSGNSSLSKELPSGEL